MSDFDPIEYAEETHPAKRTTDQEIGLIAALMDGRISHFEFRDGLFVHRFEGHIAVTQGPPQDVLGGRMTLTDDYPFVHDWLEAKAEHYRGVAR